MSAAEGKRAVPSRVKLEWVLVVAVYTFLAVFDVVVSHSWTHHSGTTPHALRATTVNRLEHVEFECSDDGITTAADRVPLGHPVDLTDGRSARSADVAAERSDFIDVPSVGGHTLDFSERHPFSSRPVASRYLEPLLASDPGEEVAAPKPPPHLSIVTEPIVLATAAVVESPSVTGSVPGDVPTPPLSSCDLAGIWRTLDIFLRGTFMGVLLTAALATLCVAPSASRNNGTDERLTTVNTSASITASLSTADASCQVAAAEGGHADPLEGDRSVEPTACTSQQLVSIAESGWVSAYESLGTAELESHRSLLELLDQLGNEASGLCSASAAMTSHNRSGGEPTTLLSWHTTHSSSGDGTLRSRSFVRCNLESIAFGGGGTSLTLPDAISQSLLGQRFTFGVNSAAGAEVPSLDVSSIVERPCGTDAAAGVNDGADGNDSVVDEPCVLPTTNRPPITEDAPQEVTTKMDGSHEWLFRVSTEAVKAWLQECEAHGEDRLTANFLTSEVMLLRREVARLSSEHTKDLDVLRQEVERANVALSGSRLQQQSRLADCADTEHRERRLLEATESDTISLIHFLLGQAIGAASAAASARDEAPVPEALVEGIPSRESADSEAAEIRQDQFVEVRSVSPEPESLCGKVDAHAAPARHVPRRTTQASAETTSRGSSPAVVASAALASETTTTTTTDIGGSSESATGPRVGRSNRNSGDAGSGSVPATPTTAANPLLSTARDALLRESRLRHVAHMELRLMELEQRRVAQAVIGEVGLQGVVPCVRSDSASCGSGGLHSQRSSCNNTPVSQAQYTLHLRADGAQQQQLQRPRGLRRTGSGTVSPLHAYDMVRLHEDVELAADSGVSRRVPRSTQSTPTAPPPDAREVHPYAVATEPADSPRATSVRGVAPGRTTTLRSPSVSSSNYPLGMLQASSTRSVSF